MSRIVGVLAISLAFGAFLAWPLFTWAVRPGWVGGAALLLAVLLRRPVLLAFAGSGFLHALVDFFVHHDDARAQFWPLTSWKFQSPISYWDRAHFGQYVGPLEIVISLGLCVLLWRRFHRMPARALIVLAAVAETAPSIMFGLMLH